MHAKAHLPIHALALVVMQGLQEGQILLGALRVVTGLLLLW
jgi:hypothetical protein